MRQERQILTKALVIWTILYANEATNLVLSFGSFDDDGDDIRKVLQ